VKRFLVKACFDVVWVLAVIFCARVFDATVITLGMTIGSLLVVKWIGDAVIAKVLPPKSHRVMTGSTANELSATSAKPSQFS